MDVALLAKIRIQNFGCIKDVSLDLAGICAMIGPNDSGKSTLLRAVRTALQLVNGAFSGGFPEIHGEMTCRPFDPGRNRGAEIELEFSEGVRYHLVFQRDDDILESWKSPKSPEAQSARRIWEPRNLSAPPVAIVKKNAFPRLVRLDADSLRQPGVLIPSSQQISLDEKGIGIASVYDALINRNLDAFLSIRNKVCDLFPTISQIGLQNIDIAVNQRNSVVKIFEITLKDGAKVAAPYMSEGLLFYLAYAALSYLEPASMLLIEEPENGLHPQRIKNIMKILREISKTTQVLIATHSPLVINEMQPQEVTILWRDNEKGTQLVPIAKTPEFEARCKIYALGELWLSYADGVDESPLRNGNGNG